MCEFIPQDFSNTIYACSQQGITPPADWLLRFWHASALKMGEFNPRNLSNTLYACGQLGVIPPADWLQLYAHACERELRDFTLQHFANITLALTILSLWELPLWHVLWEHICAAMPRDAASWNTELQLQAMQLYQVYTAASVERPGLLPAPSPAMLAGVRKCWMSGLQTDNNARTSKLHADVSAHLSRLGVAHANERWCDRTERSVDIAIEGSPPVAVEVDGPSHFLQDGRLTGSTLLRNRMLAAHGWRVVVVDYRAWEERKTQEQREEYLRSLLAQRGPAQR
jgi:hypothetical protein